MKRVIIASKNPVKIGAVTNGFKSLMNGVSFTFEGISAKSGVPEQPRGNDETLLGARNRAENAKNAQQGADYYVGIEGGVDSTPTGTEAFAWVCVIDKHGKIGFGKTGSFYLPDAVTRLLDQGFELGDADDHVFNKVNSKQNNGAVGILTHDVISRESYYADAVVLALIPFANPDFY